ncbi:MAG: Holliday junction branch migration protein RuvA, partial [Prochlorococcaceae cyanobacterium]
MIGWLEGRLAETWQQASRQGILLICQGVGYELQLGQRQWQGLPAAGSVIQLHVHHSVREDGWTLFGFADRQERELFRELIAVSGVGPQVALGLLGAMPAAALVQAVVDTDLRLLCQAPGVGRRTAERLAVELRQRVQERFADLVAGGLQDSGDAGEDRSLPDGASRQERVATLEALGYAHLEIQRALRAGAAAGLDAEAPVESWMR